MNLQAHRIQTLCEELRVLGVWKNHGALAKNATETEQNFVLFLEAALNAESDSHRAQSAATMILMAGFPATKTLEDYDFKFATTATKLNIEALAFIIFIARTENLVFLGLSGVDQTHLAIAYGHKASSAGIKTRFTMASDLILQVKAAARSSSLATFRKGLSRYCLLIIDETGYLPLARQQAHLFTLVIASRYE